MFQPGIASELSRLAVRERIGLDSARDRLLLTPDPRPASERRFDGLLSAAGAAGLLGLILLGPAGFVFVVGAATLAVALAARPDSGRDDPPSTDDPWQPWRHVDPDLEYLRPRRRAA